MIQRSRMLHYSSKWNWHVDHIPGTYGYFADLMLNPIEGYIANIHSEVTDATTEFLRGNLKLYQEKMTDPTYKTSSNYINGDSGDLPEYHTDIEKQIKEGRLSIDSIQANTVYKYDSTMFHKAPYFGTQNKDLYRLLIRINTPPEYFDQHFTHTNKIIETPSDQYYIPGKKPDSWKKIIC